MRKGEGKPIVSLGQLEELAQESNAIPEIANLDQPFVLNYFCDYENTKFGIFWSTNRLLSLTSLSSSINIDATYKLNYLGYPVMLCGTTDKKRQFHPFGVALLADETSDSFKFMFSSLLKYNPQYKPNILIADCAQAITNAFTEVFGKDFTRIFCWYHCKAKMDTKLKTIPIEKRRKIDDDLH